MKRISLNVMDRLYLADDIKEIKDAFRYRQRIKTRWDNVKPRSIKEELEGISLKTDN